MEDKVICGIWGIVSDGKADYQLKKKLVDYMKMACVVGIVRGDDSTGMFQVDKNLKIFQHKLPISGYFFTGDKRTQFLMNRSDDALITIGHHRAATVGDISRENCHPFEHYDSKRLLIGVHNGRVWSSKSEEDGKKFEVDSDWLMYRMFRDTAPKALGELDGDIATLWYENDSRLRMFSNGKRSLHWAYVRGTNAMLIASEHEMIYWCANKAGLDIEEAFWKPGSDKNIMVFDPSNVRDFEVVKVIEKPKPEPALLDNWRNRISHMRPGPVGPAGNEANFSNGRTTSSLSTSSRNFKRLDASRTFQGITISYEKLAVEKLGLDLGMEVDFQWDNKIKVPDESSNVVGEILVESPTLKDSKGEPEILNEIAMIASCSNEDKISIRLAEHSKNKGRVICRVTGITHLTVGGKDKTCVVLSPPIKYSYGNTDLFNTEEDLAARVDEQIKAELKVLDVPGPNSKNMPIKDFLTKTKGGCSSCECSLTINDAVKNNIHWEANSNGSFDPMCKGCALELGYLKATVN